MWGYREDSITPELIYIDTLESSVPNTGKVQGYQKYWQGKTCQTMAWYRVIKKTKRDKLRKGTGL